MGLGWTKGVLTPTRLGPNQQVYDIFNNARVLIQLRSIKMLSDSSSSSLYTNLTPLLNRNPWIRLHNGLQGYHTPIVLDRVHVSTETYPRNTFLTWYIYKGTLPYSEYLPFSCLCIARISFIPEVGTSLYQTKTKKKQAPPQYFAKQGSKYAIPSGSNTKVSPGQRTFVTERGLIPRRPTNVELDRLEPYEG